MAEVRFYFDFLSPYAYVGWHLAQRITRARDVRLEPAPIALAALLNHHGTKGPAEVPAKRSYAFTDAYRKAARAGLPPLTPPPSHPFNPLLALRVASLPLPDRERARVIDALFEATWATGRGTSEPDAVVRTLDELGLDGRDLVQQAGEAASKERLRETTTRAISEGVFGVPTAMLGTERFFGVDGLEFLAAALDGADPAADLDIERWERLPASAGR